MKISRPKDLPLSDVNISVPWYPRRLGRDLHHVRSFIEILQDGREEELPPIEVTIDHLLVDGLHRYYAYREVGRERIAAIVLDGEENEYWERAVQANVRNGLPLKPDDRRDSFDTLWDHHLAKEWRGKHASLASISGIFNVSRSTVKRWIDAKEHPEGQVHRPSPTRRVSQEEPIRPSERRSADAPASLGRATLGAQVTKAEHTIDLLRQVCVLAADEEVTEGALLGAIKSLVGHHLSIFMSTAQASWPKLHAVMEAFVAEVEG